MKRTLIYILVVATLLLAACQPATSQATEAAPGGGETSDRCGDRSQLADEIFLYTWVEYIDPDLKAQLKLLNIDG